MLGKMSVMGTVGDSKVAWDSEKPDEVEAAKKMFNDLVGKGYVAFKVKGEGKKGERIQAFDPSEERLILVPPIAGG